jgi:hypothetical protein
MNNVKNCDSFPCYNCGTVSDISRIWMKNESVDVTPMTCIWNSYRIQLLQDQSESQLQWYTF